MHTKICSTAYIDISIKVMQQINQMVCPSKHKAYALLQF